MQKVIDQLKEIESGEVGIIVYSQMKQTVISSFNNEISVPLASAAKVAIGFCIAKWIEEKHFHWNDIVEDISFNPDEDSNEIYPHFQHRRTLSLQDAVEVMITCHDSFIANRIVQFCGGWEKFNKEIKLHFNNINITQNPRDLENNGELSQILDLLCFIFQGYKSNPVLWTPIINGFIRQKNAIEGIPNHLLNHMTGGLENVVIDIGIIGEFHRNPLLYILGAKNLPNRNINQLADEQIIEAMKLLYKEYLKQEVEV